MRRSCRSCSRALAFRSVFGLSAIFLSIAPAHAQKTDVLILSNGDHVTGEIKEFNRGKVRFKTDPMGTVYVKWQDIVSITSDKTFEIELTSGQKFFGSLQPAPETGQLEIVTREATVDVRHLSVVRVTPIKSTFWSRLDGSIDLGLSFLQQNSQFDYNLGVEARYRAANSQTTLKVSSIVRLQDEAETTNRQSVTLAHVQSFAPRWFWAGLGAFDKNAELSLAGRGSAGGGAGRFFVQTNKVNLLIWGGVIYAHEQFEDQSPDNLLNGIVSTLFDFFVDRDRKSDITANVDIIPSFTQGGRVRIESSLEGRHEFVKDFFFKLSLLNSFDSKPPTEGTTRKNDLALTTSIGYSF
ncbi:MAG: DUF481 domain-containing protein [Gemmatimonadota bacterium]|nr:MAG: DUF481 domain-containing protein [Gemmatimonadota bacterium]